MSGESDLYFRQIPVGEMANFAYLVGSQTRHEALVVDPAMNQVHATSAAQSDVGIDNHNISSTIPVATEKVDRLLTGQKQRPPYRASPGLVRPLNRRRYGAWNQLLPALIATLAKSVATR